MEKKHDHKLPFDVHALMPSFSYHPHSGWTQLTLAVVIGLVLGAFILLGYLFFI